MFILLAGTMVTWLAVCVFVVALCVVAKRGDTAMIDAQAATSDRSLPDAARRGAATAIARPLHLV